MGIEGQPMVVYEGHSSKTCGSVRNIKLYMDSYMFKIEFERKRLKGTHDFIDVVSTISGEL